MIAKNLKEALNILDPARSLKDEPELDKYFVERDGSPLLELKTFLQYSNSPKKILFSGHRGTGKSTELAKLRQELRDYYFIIHYSIKDVADSYNLDYRDVLVTLALQLGKKVLDEKISINVELIRQLENFTKDITKEIEIKAPGSTGLDLEVNLYLAKISTKFGVEEATRTIIREKVVPRIAELLETIRLFAAEIKRVTGKQALAIIEDLDKADLEIAKGLFYDRGLSLSEPQLSIIYTFPVALRHDNNSSQIRQTFPKTIIFPIINVMKKDGKKNDAGIAKLSEILTKRVDSALFTEDALALLAYNSGGIPRELITLAQDACLKAMVDGSAKIANVHVKDAIQNKKNEFLVMLTPSYVKLLREVHQGKPSSLPEEHRDLLHNLSLLEYRNGDVWYDINPVIESIINPAV